MGPGTRRVLTGDQSWGSARSVCDAWFRAHNAPHPLVIESTKGQGAHPKRHCVPANTSDRSQLRRPSQHPIQLARQPLGFDVVSQKLETAAAQSGVCAEHRLLHRLRHPASTRCGAAIAPSAAAPRAEREARRETVATVRRAKASKLVPFMAICWDREARNDDQDRPECRRHPSAYVWDLQPARCHPFDRR